MMKQSLPPQLGGTGTITIYANDTHNDLCPLESKIEYRRFPTGLSTPVGESFEVVIINKSTQSYVADIRLIGTHEATGITLNNRIANALVLLSEDISLLSGQKNGPLIGLILSRNPSGRAYQYQFVRRSTQLPTEDWRNYRWAVEISNCHIMADEEMKELIPIIQQRSQEIEGKRS